MGLFLIIGAPTMGNRFRKKTSQANTVLTKVLNKNKLGPLKRAAKELKRSENLHRV